MTKKISKMLFSTFLLLSFPSCGWIQGLRNDIDEDSPTARERASDLNLSAAEMRNLPPPPQGVLDKKADLIAGTSVDYSGNRAKNIRVTSGEFFSDNAKNENSLWSEDGQGNYLFAQNKLKAPGDLISVVIEDRLRNDMVAEVKKLLPPEYRGYDVRVPGLTKEKPIDPKTGKPDETAAVSTESGPDDVLTAEVLERYQNGNLRIRGIKRVPFRRQVRNIEVLAILKGVDVDDKDTVKSSKFFEHRVEMYQ